MNMVMNTCVTRVHDWWESPYANSVPHSFDQFINNLIVLPTFS